MKKPAQRRVGLLPSAGNKKAPPGFPVGLCLGGLRLVGYLFVQMLKSCMDE